MLKFPPQDREKLKTIGVTSLLDLALFLPQTFEDYRLTKHPTEGECVVEVELKGFTTKGQNMLLVSAICHAWRSAVRIIIFNAKPWHYGAFKGGKTVLIHAKSEFRFDTWQFVNPRIISKTGGIRAIYKTDLTDETITSLKATYVTSTNLTAEGLTRDEANLLLKLNENERDGLTLATNLPARPDIVERLKRLEAYNYALKISHKKSDFLAPECTLFDLKEWLANLPFTPTNDQKNAINEIRADLASQKASKRVVMGDVGSGKTLVMLASALSVFPQIALIMAPTSILAEQIYNEAKRLLPEFLRPVLVKSRTKKQKLEDAHLIVGTHALLWAELPPCVIVMVDEQHRFGSAQRELISKLVAANALRPHFVQFSATPIPRTLTLMQGNFVKFSLLKEIPFEKKIQTIILQNQQFPELLTHLKSEFKRGKQAIVVYPLVSESQSSVYQSLNESAPFWQSKFEKVFVTHGSDKEKERILEAFRESGNLLLTTTIVEVGISLPRLTTIVIVGAERLGLATLHQLRGRVGRNGGEGWCYIYTKLREVPKRLVDFSRTLDGFEIARLDLANRKCGDLLDGTSQHGQMFRWLSVEDEAVAKEASERVAGVAKFDDDEEVCELFFD